jgi:hypothetical protein
MPVESILGYNASTFQKPLEPVIARELGIEFPAQS